MIPILDQLPYSHADVRLRRLRESDLQAFARYRGDPDVARFQGWAPMSEAKALTFIQEQCAPGSHAPGRWFQLAIADAATDALIGDLGVWLSSDRTAAEIGITVTPASQGQGVGRAAIRAASALLFADPVTASIRADTDARNHACRRMLAAVGFREIGTAEVFVKEEACVEHRHLLEREAYAPEAREKRT